MRACSAPASSGWHSLFASSRELRLHATLENGQTFGWHRQPDGESDEPVWVGVLGRRLLALRQTETGTYFRCLSSLPASAASPVTTTSTAAEAAAALGSQPQHVAALREELHDYFQMAQPLLPLYEAWSAADPRMNAVARALPGMRVLRQDPTECLFSFICSSNNNIGRIGGMLQALRRAYGSPLPSVAPSAAFEPVGIGGATEFFTFPSAEALAAASETELRALGLGYRAAFVRQTAATIVERGPQWLPSLRSNADPAAVRAELCELSGVGPKVADCVALFSLDQTGAVPVDTHVWDIACRDLDPTLITVGSLTPTVYARVGDLFRARYGLHAGWAHSVLFAAEVSNSQPCGAEAAGTPRPVPPLSLAPASGPPHPVATQRHLSALGKQAKHETGRSPPRCAAARRGVTPTSTRVPARMAAARLPIGATRGRAAGNGRLPRGEQGGPSAREARPRGG